MALLARRDEHALFLSVVRPSARSRLAAVLLGVPLDPLLELGSEMSDEALERPCESFAERYR